MGVFEVFAAQFSDNNSPQPGAGDATQHSFDLVLKFLKSLSVE
jgi:hypothetical protein